MVDYKFYISEDNHFIVPEYDIDFLFSPSESSIPEIAEASDSTVKIAGRDGEVVLDTTYEPLDFTIVAYTDENLEPNEKVNEIFKLTSFLNSMKKTFKSFAFLESEKMYSVKYSNQLVTTKFPKSIRFEIPLKSSRSYGTALNKTVIEGAGVETSESIEKTGCIITINGYCNNPIISLNDYQMEYEGVVLAGNKLVINTGNSTITHITSLGVATNAAMYYNHEYPKIQPGENEIKVLSGIDNATQVHTEWYDLKL